MQQPSPMDVSSDQKQPETIKGQTVDDVLLYFARFPLSQLQPRGLTGSIRVRTSGNAVVVQENERISRAFYKLVTEGFLSAPVLNMKNEYVGMIDQLGLVTYTVGLFGEIKAQEMSEADWERCFESERKFTEARVEDVLKQSGVQPPNPVHATSTVFSALEVFGKTGARSLPVISPDDGRVVGIVTQSMAISLLSQALPMLSPIKDTLVKQMHDSLKTDVFTVKDSERAIDAFKLMSEKKVSGVGVVNDQGLLVDTLSVRDLRGMGTNGSKFRRLFQSVKEFKRKVSQDFPVQTPSVVLGVTCEDTLGTVIKLMDDGNIHRIFEIEGEKGKPGKPLHVISQVDVIRFLLQSARVPTTAGTQGESVKVQDQGQGQGQGSGSQSQQPQSGGISIGQQSPLSTTTGIKQGLSSSPQVPKQQTSPAF